MVAVTPMMALIRVWMFVSAVLMSAAVAVAAAAATAGIVMSAVDRVVPAFASSLTFRKDAISFRFICVLNIPFAAVG